MESLTQSRLEELELLLRIGTALSAERSKDRLIEMILLEAKELCNADGGTLYLRADDTLRFAILRTDSLGTALGGSAGTPVDLPPLPLYDPLTGEPNRSNVATYAALLKQSVNIPDAYATSTEFDFSGTKTFDERNDYRSQSFLTVPLINNEGLVIGVLQLLNAEDPDTGERVPFRADHQRVVESLASQAGIALDNQLLLEGQRELLESFIQMIAAAIDAKSPYTGGHCERVPILTEMLVRAACDDSEGAFRDFSLSDEEWYELRIAAWLHDCGKVTTPVHVMDKATKLETIYDRIGLIRARFAVLERDARIAMLEALAAGAPQSDAQATFDATVRTLREELSFLESANVGSEFLPDAARVRIAEIGARRYVENGQERTLLDADEVYNLQIQRGTLTSEERLVINGHMVQTVKMLERLPFPRNLRRVPEYAGGHHEKMDGGGYPKGVFAGDMSVPARIMAIADVFEALTAQDRPYKKGKTLAESMRIMAFMKRDNHLDPALFDLFVRSGVYREYGRKYLPPELIDEVDEAALLAVEPKPFALPPEGERQRRFLEFLPEYMEATVAGELSGPA
jgi:HD-GYP domain-containing protein (c-di-GMP phosphodiesterase class II)